MALINLHPWASYDPSIEIHNNQFYSKLWAIATVVTGIAFIAIAGAAIGFTSLYWEAQLPLVSIILLYFALKPSSDVINHLWNRSSQYEDQSKLDQKLIDLTPDDENKKISNKITFNKNGVTVQLLQHKQTFTTACKNKQIIRKLSSRYFYFKEQMNLFKTSANNYSKEITGNKTTVANLCLGNINAPENLKIFHTLQQKRIQMLHDSQRAAYFHLQATFVCALIHNPHYLKNWTSYFNDHGVSIISLDPTSRLIAQAYKDASSNTILSKDSKDCTTIKQLLAQNPTETVKEFLI